MTQTALLVFARAAGMMFRAPGFSHPSVPPPVRVALALALAFAVAPDVRPVSFDGLRFVPALAGETLLGAAIGTGASLLYDAAYYAGRTIDDYVGVRGSVPNANVTSAQAFGRLWSSVFLAGFFLLDGYVPVVRAFADSFASIAPGGAVAPGCVVCICGGVTGDDRPGGAADRRTRAGRRADGAGCARRRVAGRAAVGQLFARLSGRLRGGDRRRADRHPAVRTAVRASVAGAAVWSAAMSEESAEKRFDATPSRRERAKREGNAARSA